jgi:hypothetical protein
VKNIKEQVESTQGVPSEQQRLIFGGRILQDHHTATESALTRAVTVNLVLRLRGGPGAEEQEDQALKMEENGGLGDSIRFATLTVNRDFGNKIKQVLQQLVMNDIDMCVLQETGIGVQIMDECKAYGFIPYKSELKDAGVTVLIRYDWDFAVIGQPEIIEEGRAIAVRVSTGERQIVLVGIYNPSGIGNLGPDAKVVKRSVKNINKAISLYDHTTQVVGT